MRLNNFGAGGNIFTKLRQTTCRNAGVITRVQLLEGPQKFARAKRTSKFRPFFDNFGLWSQIYPEWIHISKTGKVFYQLPPLPRRVKKIGVFWSINEKVIESNVYRPQSTFFQETTFRPLGSAAPLKFLNALETDQGLLAHTAKGDEGPPTKI